MDFDNTTSDAVDLSIITPTHVLSQRECIKQSTDRVLKLLLAMPESGVVTLSEIAETCHGSVRPKYIRDKARKLAQNRHGVLFEPARGVALRRLPTDTAAPVVAMSARRRMRNSLNSLKLKVQAIDYGALSTDKARADYVVETVRIALREELNSSEERQALKLVSDATAMTETKAVSGADKVRELMRASMGMLSKVG